MDIGSGNGYPESALSNFAPHQFEIDGITCHSMEGFLQSLKFQNPDMQAHTKPIIGAALDIIRHHSDSMIVKQEGRHLNIKAMLKGDDQ